MSDWRADPFGRFPERLFVGGAATEFVRENGVEQTDPNGAEPSRGWPPQPSTPAATTGLEPTSGAPLAPARRVRAWHLLVVAVVVLGIIAAAVVLSGSGGPKTYTVEKLQAALPDATKLPGAYAINNKSSTASSDTNGVLDPETGACKSRYEKTPHLAGLNGAKLEDKEVSVNRRYTEPKSSDTTLDRDVTLTVLQFSSAGSAQTALNGFAVPQPFSASCDGDTAKSFSRMETLDFAEYAKISKSDLHLDDAAVVQKSDKVILSGSVTGTFTTYFQVVRRGKLVVVADTTASDLQSSELPEVSGTADHEAASSAIKEFLNALDKS